MFAEVESLDLSGFGALCLCFVISRSFESNYWTRFFVFILFPCQMVWVGHRNKKHDNQQENHFTESHAISDEYEMI